jgi:hypothetical protein
MADIMSAYFVTVSAVTSLDIFIFLQQSKYIVKGGLEAGALPFHWIQRAQDDREWLRTDAARDNLE